MAQINFGKFHFWPNVIFISSFLLLLFELKHFFWWLLYWGGTHHFWKKFYLLYIFDNYFYHYQVFSENLEDSYFVVPHFFLGEGVRFAKHILTNFPDIWLIFFPTKFFFFSKLSTNFLVISSNLEFFCWYAIFVRQTDRRTERQTQTDTFMNAGVPFASAGISVGLAS